MLQQAKNEGLTINVRHAKILFCGAAKAGKTSFSRLLRNEKHKLVYKSTPAANPQQVLISDKVNVVGTNWVSLDSKLEIKQVTERLILKLRDKIKSKSDGQNIGPCDDQYPEDDTQKFEQNLTDSSSKESNSVAKSNVEFIKENISEKQPLSSKPKSIPLMSWDSTLDSGYTVPTSKPTDIEEQMATHTENVTSSILKLVETIPETWDMFTLLDTGGQPEFINMLPAINSSTAITFIVLDMSDGKACLDNLVTAQYMHEDYNYDVHKLKYTNMHLLKCLLSSIKVAAIKKDNFYPEIIKKVAKDKHPKPVVAIIGTFFDILQENFGENYHEELCEINNEIKKVVRVISDNNVLVVWCKGQKDKYVIPIDNTTSRKQCEVKCETAEAVYRIREQSNEILRKKAQYEIPISWFILELELRNQTKVCIHLDEVKSICDRIMPSHRQLDLLQIKEVLKFYHMCGMLLYYSEVDGMNNYVITNPEWLFRNLTKIIMCKYIKDSNSIYNVYLLEEMDKGICSIEMLKTLKLDLSGIELDSFINLLKYLKLIAPMKTLENACFIPSLLPPCPEENIFTDKDFGKSSAYTMDEQLIHPEVEPLLIAFTFGTIPRGLFGSLVVQLLQDNTDTYELCENDDMQCQYSDAISFFLKPYWHVSLHDRISFLELQVRVMGNEYSCHFMVQTTVSAALRKVCDEFNWQFSDCRYGFLCRQHELSSQDKHLTLLYPNPPYVNEIPKSACCKSRPTVLSKAHTIWFEVC